MPAEKSKKIQKKLKLILKQLSGKIKEGEQFVQEAVILGKGSIWCYDPYGKTVVKTERGINVHILEENYDSQGRTLIYCVNGDILCIEAEELYMLGFN
jgi:hypothetical protein|tara:strand:+ start:547 stop:840 length:294 start_codon:yes stop_codon:yes gene_type:complete